MIETYRPVKDEEQSSWSPLFCCVRAYDVSDRHICSHVHQSHFNRVHHTVGGLAEWVWFLDMLLVLLCVSGLNGMDTSETRI